LLERPTLKEALADIDPARRGFSSPIEREFKMRIRLLATAIAIAFSSLAHAGDTADFVKKAREAGDFEIATSQLALEKSKAPNVRKFAQQMIDDHTAAAQELEKAAAEGAPSAEKQPVKRAEKHARDIERLRDAGAGEFDATYIEIQRNAHEEAVELFSTYAESGDNAKLKAFAAATLPTLKSHLSHVKTITISKM
jgi:putative membrane protein